MTSARPRTPARLAARLTLVVLVGVPAASRAHPLTFTETTIVLRPDGSFQTDLICDLDALALGAPQNADDAALVAALGALAVHNMGLAPVAHIAGGFAAWREAGGPVEEKERK